MRFFIIATLCVVPGLAMAKGIKPMDSKPNVYLVDGKEVTAGEATLAAIQGSNVTVCKPQTASAAKKVFMVKGEIVQSTDIKTCTVMEVQETRTGLALKAKK